MVSARPSVTLALVGSRKFWLTLVGVINVVAGQWFGIDPAVTRKVTDLILALVAAITVEDAATKLKGG